LMRVEMRQRKICFDASPQAEPYLLMYGDPALRAPLYDGSRPFATSENAVAASLDAEEKNPGYIPRRDVRPYAERHPELLWVGLLSVVGGLGSMALRGTKRRGRQR